MQEEKPLVSVLISSFNHERFASLAIDSVLKQSYPNIELLVVDDGSSDRTPEILEKISREEGFHFLARENKGLTYSMNELIEKSKGEFICPLGSDDIFMLDKVEKQVNFFNANPSYGVCGGNFLTIDEEGAVLSKQKIRPARDLVFSDIFLGLQPGIPAGSAMIRRSILPSPAYDPNIELEDLFLWLKISERGIPIYVLNDILYYYRKHSSNVHKDIKKMHYNVMKIYDHFSENEKHSRCVEKFNIQTALRAAKMGEKKFARKLLSEIPASAISTKTIRSYYHAYKLW